jgi:hypothetical protein
MIFVQIFQQTSTDLFPFRHPRLALCHTGRMHGNLEHLCWPMAAHTAAGVTIYWLP